MPFADVDDSMTTAQDEQIGSMIHRRGDEGLEMRAGTETVGVPV